MKKNYILIFTLFVYLFVFQSHAQSTLAPGEIVFTAYNADGNPDRFSFVFLRNVDSGTEFFITDDSDWNGTSFGNIEGTYKFTATTTISAGEEVHVTHNGSTVTMTTTSTNTLGTIVETDSGFVTSFAGDNLFLYQDQMGTQVLIAGLNMELGNLGTSGNAWETSNSGTSDTALPAGKTNGQDGFVGLFPNGENPEVDNARYKGGASISYSGSNVDLLNAIMDWNNWEYSNSIPWPSNTNTFVVNNPPLSVEDNTLSKEDFSYINPVSKKLIIESSLEISSIKVFNLNGDEVASSYSNTVNMEVLASGFYICIITSERGLSTYANVIKK